MNRAKTFDATGIAPNGRLYAGDLNLIQDLAAALTDLTQNIQAGSLTVGESGLTLSRFGAGEGVFAGALRATGLLRGLGGLLAGTYDQAARDAIPAGKAPFGVIILRSDISKYQWNKGTDGARVWENLGGTVYKTSFTIGDGSAVNFNLAHGQGTRDLFVVVREANTPWRVVYPDISFPDANTVKVSFATPPANNSYVVTIFNIT